MTLLSKLLVSDGPVYLAGIKDMLAKSEIKGWETSWAILEQQLITYNQLIAKEVLPLARNDHKLPAEVYANNLREFGVDISPEELISKALTSFAEIRNQMTISAGIVAKEHHFADADYRAVIRENKIAQMYSAIQTGQQFGMQTLDQCLQELLKRNIISLPEARMKAAIPDNFRG